MASKKKTSSNIDFDCSLSQDCLDYLKINKQPFAADILTAETFFNFPALEKIIENLQHQVQFSDLLLIVEGPYGSGKTSLFRNFMLHEIANTKSLPIQAEATDTLVQIQQKISDHLQDLGDANHLDDNLKSLESFGQTPLIIIDNFHVLSDTTLQELIRYKDQLKSEHDINLKFILFANDGISNTLKNVTALDSNKMYVQSMPAYIEKLTAELISHKLHNAGYNGDILLNENELQLIDNKSSHSPLSIMHIASNIIEKKIANTLNPPKPLWVKSLIGLALLIIVTIAISIYFDLLDTDKFISDAKKTPEPAVVINEKTLTTTDNQESLAPASEIHSEIDSPLLNPRPVENPKSESPIALDIENEVDTALTDDINTSEIPVTSSSKKHPEEPIKEPAITEVVTKPLLPASPPENKIEAKKPLAKQQALEPQNEKPEKEVSAATNTKETIKPIHPALEQLNRMGLHDSNWLLKQKNTAWTLQLLGAREPETLLTFSRQYSLTHNAAWYKTWLKGKPYYVLVYGNYANRDQARNSIATLPKNLRSIKPWVKSMSSVQQTIK